MSLLGRLEDLSLTDIIQIVYLSRRTGVLEIIDDSGRHTVLFRHGLVVNASSPEHPDLVAFLAAAGLVPQEKVTTIRQMEESGIPGGTAVLEMNLLSEDDLTEAVRQRVARVVGPLLQSKEGEFNFILSDSMTALDIEYEPEQLFKEGGLAPNRLLGTAEGEKLKPLRGLEESLKAGKALLRGAMSESAPSSLNLGLGQSAEPDHPLEAPPEQEPPAPARADPADNVVPFPRHTPRPGELVVADFTPIEDLPFPELDAPAPEPAPFDSLPLEPPAAEGLPLDELPRAAEPPLRSEGAQTGRSRSSGGQFKVAGGLFEVESPEAAFRNVVLFERNPLVRVAARRAFTRHNVKIAQYGALDDVRSAITDLFRSNSFFVTFLKLTAGDASVRLMQQLKRKNPRLPVVVVDAEADLRRRHDLLRAGADLYLTKPSPARLQPGLAEEELAMFADELVLFAERSFLQWEQLTGGGIEAGKKFYEMASKETMDRSFGVLRQLINELSNPNDIGQVSSTILRMSAEYVDRGALFMVREAELVGLGGFGNTGGGEELDKRIARLRIARDQASILSEVAAAGEPHQGKMRKTPVNVQLIETMGGLLPTEVIVLPIMHAGRPIGILYGDNAENRAPIDSMTGLEIFLSQAGYAFGNAVFASEKSGQF